MKLSKLLEGVKVLSCTADPETEITNIAYDSRKARQGSLFVAIAGFCSDGNRFIPGAMEKGAAVVVTAKKPENDVPYVLVESDRLALARISANFYDHPGEAMTLVGVTGTNGKTSVTLLLKHVLETVTGAKVGLVGTMYNMVGDKKLETGRTTPESLELQELFAQMRDAGCRYAVMEVSSHALALERVGGIRFDVAAFTNLTEDHLDFHKTMEAYCDAKAELFRRCGKGVLNRDDPWFPRISAGATCSVFTTSLKDEGDLRAVNPVLHSDGVSFTAKQGGKEVAVRLGIPGEFTVSNAMTVLGIAVNLGISLEDAAEALRTAPGVKGRVEVVPTPGKPYTVLIDYAHTPDGLSNVLRSVRGFCKGRLISVFGCGGDRDPMKRPIMGAIGAELSDVAVITSDNPRSEEPMAIIRDILAGIGENAKNTVVIADRRSAIDWALKNAEKDDIIVLAGKGHETYQEIQGVKYPMDEREIVADCLKEG
ncbi:MAG: UDP-N-acetylmuramoyl-L-alanyl-D-glutamate--2,6-diaminopimelate ligase [Faecousia sp.]